MPSPERVEASRRVILALGGHEFTLRPANAAIVEFMLALAPPRPQVCLLPTASGDAHEQIRAFRRMLGGRAAELSEVSLFRLEHERMDVREHLLSRDLVYVGGGSMLNLLAVWRAHGIGEILLEAWRRGVVLCGQSAGAMCWFEAGVSRSAGRASKVPGLGAIPGTLSVHYHRDADRRAELHRLVEEGASPAFGVCDGAGLLVRGTRVAGAVSGMEGARAWRVARGEDGTARETEIPGLDVSATADAGGELDAIAELRAVRAVRSGHAGGPRAVRGR